MECIILSVRELYMDAQEDMHMNDYNKITALYSLKRLAISREKYTYRSPAAVLGSFIGT